MSLHNRYEQTTLTEYQAKEVLRDNNIPTPYEEHVTTPEQAAEAVENIGYPAIIKINSPDISHKSDIGGVITVDKGDNVIKQCETMLEQIQATNPDARTRGFLVAEVVEGTEFILGINTDPQFGKVILFGLGGVNVELFDDISVRLAPIDKNDAKDMINELKSSKLLEGYRTTSKTDKEKLAGIIVEVSDLITSHPEIKEMDINPLFIDGNQIVAADALITLEEPQ